MTENEAIEWLKHTREYQHKCDNCEHIDISGACNEECKDFYDLAIQALEEIQQYRAIGTVEEVEIPRSKGNEIVAGIMLPKVKGKAVVSLSDLHDILMDVGGINIRDKVFEQIYNRDVIIGLKDVIEKWEERKSMQNNCKYWNADHEDCALSCEEIRNKAIDEFVNTLIPRLTDAIYQKDVESMTNLINDVARELKAGAV